MESTRYLEINVDNDTEKKFRIFVKREYSKVHYSGGISDDSYDEIIKHDIEITSGNSVNEYNDYYKTSLRWPINIMNFTYDEFSTIYFRDWKEEKELIGAKAFEELINNTNNKVAYYNRFLFYKTSKFVSPKEISEYLKKIADQGKVKEYYQYVKNLVLDFQRKYINAMTPYYEKIMEIEAEKQKANKERRIAESHIYSFTKKLNNK